MGGHWIFCIALACAALGTGQNPSGPLITVGQKPGEHGLTAEQKRLNIQSFEFIWSTIRDQYWDPSFGGVNWIDVHDELGPELERAVTMQQAREVMGQMMGRLGKSHFALGNYKEAIETALGIVTVTWMSPSFISGRNSAPSRGTSDTASASTPMPAIGGPNG